MRFPGGEWREATTHVTLKRHWQTYVYGVEIDTENGPVDLESRAVCHARERPHMSVRAKFRCQSVKFIGSLEPQEVTSYNGTREEIKSLTWPRVYEFTAVYDMSIPEDERYAKHTPYGKLEMWVDNPAVSFTSGQSYYLDFTAVEPASNV